MAAVVEDAGEGESIYVNQTFTSGSKSFIHWHGLFRMSRKWCNNSIQGNHVARRLPVSFPEACSLVRTVAF